MEIYDRLQLAVNKMFQDFDGDEECTARLGKLVLFMALNDQNDENLIACTMLPSNQDHYFYLTFKNLNPSLQTAIMHYFEFIDIPTSISNENNSTRFGLVTSKFIDKFLPLAKQALPHYLKTHEHNDIENPPAGIAPEYDVSKILCLIQTIENQINSNNLTAVTNFLTWTADQLGIRQNHNLHTAMKNLSHTLSHKSITAEKLESSEQDIIQATQHHPELLLDRNLIDLMKNLRHYKMALFTTEFGRSSTLPNGFDNNLSVMLKR